MQPKADREIALAFFDVVRQQIKHQLGDAIEKLAGLQEFAHEGGNFGIEPGFLAELRHEMRIGKKAHIENHVRIERNAILETEAQAGDQQALGFLFAAKAGQDVCAQLVHIEVGCVDQGVGDVANGIEELPFFHEGPPHRL